MSSTVLCGLPQFPYEIANLRSVFLNIIMDFADPWGQLPAWPVTAKTPVPLALGGHLLRRLQVVPTMHGTGGFDLFKRSQGSAKMQLVA